MSWNDDNLPKIVYKAFRFSWFYIGQIKIVQVSCRTISLILKKSSKLNFCIIMRHHGISLLQRLFLGQSALTRRQMYIPTTCCSSITQFQQFSSTSTPEKGTLISIPEVKRFILDCMTKVGTEKKHAIALADVLLAADYRGHYSHGLNRLGNKSHYQK